MKNPGRGRARQRHDSGWDVPAAYTNDRPITISRPQGNLICDGGEPDDPLDRWEGHEDKLELIIDGDHGLLSELAEQILARLEEGRNGSRGE